MRYRYGRFRFFDYTGSWIAILICVCMATLSLLVNLYWGALVWFIIPIPHLLCIILPHFERYEFKDGEICAIQLSDDFTRAVGEPFVLFRASETPNVSEVGKGSGYYITDGPFLYNENGKLNLMWSSFYKGKYQVLLAQSDSLKGKWEHKGCQFDFDGGHAMLFKTLDGVRMISLHSPNVIGDERAFFCEY